MEPKFWHQVWKNNSIGFHQMEFHPWLKNITEEKMAANVFVPLCGKSLDMWPLAASYDGLIGAELSEIACRDFFTQAKLTPEISNNGQHQQFRFADSEVDIALLMGDYFALSPEQFNAKGGFDIFDRAAMVALPQSMRQAYVDKLRELFKHTTLFIMTLEFDQNEISGPPFCLNDTMINQYFGFATSAKLLESKLLDDKVFAQRKLKVSSLRESLYQITW